MSKPTRHFELLFQPFHFSLQRLYAVGGSVCCCVMLRIRPKLSN